VVQLVGLDGEVVVRGVVGVVDRDVVGDDRSQASFDCMTGSSAPPPLNCNVSS